jgi:hypothetical protein
MIMQSVEPDRYHLWTVSASDRVRALSQHGPSNIDETEQECCVCRQYDIDRFAEAKGLILSDRYRLLVSASIDFFVFFEIVAHGTLDLHLRSNSAFFVLRTIESILVLWIRNLVYLFKQHQQYCVYGSRET